jgi:hypothetical protein
LRASPGRPLAAGIPFSSIDVQSEESVHQTKRLQCDVFVKIFATCKVLAS